MKCTAKEFQSPTQRHSSLDASAHAMLKELNVGEKRLQIWSFLFLSLHQGHVPFPL
jgi:hypothetical protein